MATFKPTSKATKTGGTTSKTFTPTKYAGYNQSKVYGWQAQNKSALDLLNEYYNRINAGEWLSNEDRAKYKSAIDTYTTTGNALRDVSKFYGTKYTDAEEKSWQDSLSSLNQGYTSVNDFYGQFADENQYNLWSRWEKPVDDVDYEKYVQTGKGSANPSWEDTRKKLFGESANVNNMVTFAENNAENAFGDALQGLRAGASGYTHTNLVNLINLYMTDEEKSRYNYYIGKGDTATAQEYLSYIENELNKRLGGEISKQVDSTVLEPFFAFESGMQSGIYGIENAVRGVLGKEGVTTSPLQYANSYSNENNKGAWKVINDLANTTGNMAPSLVIGAINPTAGAVTMGVSAGGNAYSEMLQQGYSVNQARAYGVMTGASEAVLSKLLGGISKLGGNSKGVFQSLSSKVLPGVNNAIGRVAIQIGGNMADEALEEGVQTLLDPVFKWAATLGEAELEKVNWEEVGYSALLGGLSAGLLEGTPTISNAVSTNLRTQKAFGSQAQNIVADALEINPNDKMAIKAQTAINKGKQVSGLTLDALLNKTDTTKVKQAVSDRLTELGERGNVAKISDAIAREQAGEELSLGEKNLIKKSDFGKSVRAELNPETLKSDTEMNRWAESIGTRRLNSDVYSKRPPSVKVQTNEGKSAEIGSIKSVEGDVATVELSDGTVAKVGLGKNTQSEVKFNDAKAEEMFKIATERIGKVEGWTVESANAMVKGYTGQIPVSDYVAKFEEAYKLGMNGAPTTEVVTLSHNTEGINQSTLLAAYDIGRQASENSVLQTPTESDIINTESEALTNEGTTVHLRDSSERIGSTNPQESVQQLENSTGQIESRGQSSRPADSEAVNLVNEGRAVRVADLGILNGSKTQTVFIVDDKNETKLMQKARKDAESKGLKIKFFVGDNIVITEQTGEISSVRGYVLGDTMLVRADHPVYTADQIERHEVGHKLIERGEIDVNRVREKVAKAVGGKENLDKAAEVYEEAYRGTGMTPQEIWEECICDSLGDMNIFAKNKEVAGAMDYTIKQVQKAVAEQKAEPNKTRGSPDAEGKASREIKDNGKLIEETEVHERRKETRDEFNRTAYEEGCTIGEKGQIAYAYRVSGEPSIEGRKTAEEIEKLGIKAVICDTFKSNCKNITTTYTGGAVTVVGRGVFINNAIERNPVETAGHEAFHYWRSTPARAILVETITDNIDFSSNDFIDFTTKIEKGYFNKEVEINGDSWNILSEEINAYIVGYIYSGDLQNTVKPFIRNYNEVKDAVDTFFYSQQQGKASRELNTEDDNYSQIYAKREDLGKLNREIEEFEKSDDFKSQMDKLTQAISNDSADGAISEYLKWKKNSGYGELLNRRDALQKEIEQIQNDFKTTLSNKALEQERIAIEKSGLTEAEYFRKLAVKEFGYTPYYYDAGYITPNGKMLNFSGEKGQHFGTRGQDHRAIGIIYAETQGTAALTRFMNDGNIRIMAETPGVDISTKIEPTKEQYSTIRSFIYDSINREYFSIDFSDENGRVLGSLQYENRINPTRIINDIKYYYETGEIREQSNVDKYSFSRELDTAYLDAVKSGDMETAQKMVDEAAKKAGYTIKAYHGTNAQFDTFDNNKAKSNTGSNFYGNGFYFTTSRMDAANYGKIIKPVYLRAEKILDLDSDTWTYDLGIESKKEVVEVGKTKIERVPFPKGFINIHYTTKDAPNEWKSISNVSPMQLTEDETGKTFVEHKLNPKTSILPRDLKNLAELAKSKGYDAIRGGGTNIGDLGTEYVVFLSSQIKSADPVTYDDDGNVIPLSERFNSENNDIRYSRELDVIDYMNATSEDGEVDTESFSNRSILANALASTVQHEVEQKKLDEYRSRIAMLDVEEAKLSKLKAEIKELTFGEKRDPARLKEIKEEARKTEARIDLHDKKLLQLESTTALKNVLEREKSRAYKRAAEKGREALRRNVEGRRTSEIRNKIRKYKDNLIKTIEHPTERKYIPIDLVKSMIDVVDLIDTDTDLYKKNGEINKAQEKRNATKERLQKLRSEYENLKTNKDPLYAGEFDEAIYDYIKELQDNYSDKSINDMSLIELTEMYEILQAINETLLDARKLIGWMEGTTVIEAGDTIVAEQDEIRKARKDGKRNTATKAKDAVIDLSLSPVRNVERMSGYNDDSPLVKLFHGFVEGVRKKNFFIMTSYRMFEKLTTGENQTVFEDARYKEFGEEMTDSQGRKFKVSKMQMMQAILSYERETANNQHHIEYGGFTFANLKLLSKGNIQQAISSENSHRVGNGEFIVHSFIKQLAGDKWCQDYMKMARKFFNENAKDAVNEATIALKHRIVARGSKYIPFEVDKNFVVLEITEDSIQQTISSYGMLKDVNKQSAQPLIMTGLDNVIDRHIEQVGNIYGLAVPIRNFNKVWNVHSHTETLGGSGSVKDAVEAAWGKSGTKVITQTVRDLQGSRTVDNPDVYNAYSAIKGNVIGATFKLNLSVVTKQIGSLFTATSMLDWRNPASMLINLLDTMKNHDTISAEVDKYTATAWMRRQGLSDAELHTLATEGQKSKLKRWSNKLPTAISPDKWITGMDSMVALSLWKYAKEDVAKRTNLKGEALLKETAKFYDELVENTQSMSDVLHRPEVQRSKNILLETLSMFKTDLYQMAGQLQGAYGRYQANNSEENGKALAKTVGSVLISTMWGTLMKTLWALVRYKVNPYRDDEDDELTIESWLSRQGVAVVADLVGYVVPLFGSEAVGIIERIWTGETEDVADSLVLSAVNDVVSAIEGVANSAVEGEFPKEEAFRGLLTKVCSLFGVPMSNILRIIEAIKLHGEDIANKEFLSFEAGLTRPNSTRLYNAYIERDPVKIERASRLYEDQKEIESALRKAIRENDPRVEQAVKARLEGDNDTYYNLMYDVIGEGNFDSKLIKDAFKAEYEYLKDKKKEAEAKK